MIPGFRTRNAQTGAVEVEVTTRLSRSIGELNISGSGFFPVPEFDRGDPWILYADLSYIPFTQAPVARWRKTGPAGPAGITWQFEGMQGMQTRPINILYGVS